MLCALLLSLQCICHHPALAKGSLQQRNLHQRLCSHSCLWSPLGSDNVPRGRSVTSPSPASWLQERCWVWDKKHTWREQPGDRGQQNWAVPPRWGQGCASQGCAMGVWAAAHALPAVSAAAAASALQQPPACAGPRTRPGPHRGQRPPSSSGAAGAACRVSRVVSVLSAEQADRRDAQGGPLLQEQPKGTWSRSWDKLHHHLMLNALWLLLGSSVEARGQSRAPPGRGYPSSSAWLGLAALHNTARPPALQAPGIASSCPDVS